MENPQGLWRDLSILALLRGYPEKLTEYSLAKERIDAFRELPEAAAVGVTRERVENRYPKGTKISLPLCRGRHVRQH